MDFLCSPKQRSCARRPAIPPSSSLPLMGQQLSQLLDPRMAATEAKQVQGAIPMAQSTTSLTAQGPKRHGDRQQQEPTAGRGTNGKICNSTQRWEAKQSLAPTPSHGLPTSPASTSHPQCLSSWSCYLQPSQRPTRPKLSLFSTKVPRNKVSTRNTKDKRSTCLEAEWARSAASEPCAQQPQVETTARRNPASPSSPGPPAGRTLLVQGDTQSSEMQLYPVKSTMARQSVRLHALHTAPRPALLPSQGTFIAIEPAPPSDIACL